MALQNATHETSRLHFRLPACPLCGDTLLAPMMAEHVSERVVRNHWACEACGYTFRKSFEFRAQRVVVTCCDA